ncbi:hypothetical protein ACRAWD_31255 [Caulobacter segnis]
MTPEAAGPSIDQLAPCKVTTSLYPFDNYFRGTLARPAGDLRHAERRVRPRLRQLRQGHRADRYRGAAAATASVHDGDFEDQGQTGGRGSTNHQKEKTLAGYAMLRFGNDVSIGGEEH